MTTGVVGKVLHFQKTNLIKAAGKDVNDMTVVRSTFGKAFVEL